MRVREHIPFYDKIGASKPGVLPPHEAERPSLIPPLAPGIDPREHQCRRHERRDFTPYRMQGHRFDNDNIFYGDRGYLMIDREGYRVFHGNEPGPSVTDKQPDDGAHYQNFIDCVKSRRREDLVAEIEDGHRSALLCHLGNIAYRTGRRLEFDATTETFPKDPEANRFLRREEYRKGYELPTV